jgi:transcription termination factor Rho
MTDDVTEEHERVLLNDLKKKTPAELLAMAEELEVEGASLLSKQELMFAILKAVAERGVEIGRRGVWKCCRTASASCARRIQLLWPARTTFTFRPRQIRKFGLRTGDTVEGQIKAPKDGERYFALTKVNRQLRRPGRVRTRSTSTT